MKERMTFDGKSQAIDVIGTVEVGMLHLKIYWRSIDTYGNVRKHLRYSTNYMTPQEARDFSDILLKMADKVEQSEKS